MSMKKFLYGLSAIFLILGIAGCNFSEVIVDDNNPNVSVCESNPTACVSPVSKTEQTYNEEEEDLTDVYNRTVKSTVTVLTYNNKYKALSSGSGVIYGTSTDTKYVYVYTNAHVVNNSNAVNFEIIYYNNIRVKATVLAKDGEEDVAVLQAEIEPNKDYLEATVGNSDALKIGQTIFAIGSPLGTDYRNTMTKGIVSGLNVEMVTDNDSDGIETRMYLIQTDAALSSGNSGGPMFNLDGQFIGINTLKLTESGSSVIEGFNFSIPSNHFVKVANELLKDGSYSRPVLGVEIADIGSLSLNEREQLKIGVSLGLYIDEILLDGASYGLIDAKRIIIKINDAEIKNTSDFISELYDFLPGERITVTTVDLNGNDQKTVEITLK